MHRNNPAAPTTLISARRAQPGATSREAPDATSRQARDAVLPGISARPLVSRPLDENHIVLINPVQRFDLKADGPAHLSLELGQGGRLVIQQAIHDVLMSQYQQLTARKLPALSHYLPKDLVAGRLRGFDEASPFAGST